MSEVLTWIVGNRNPSITENIVDDDDAVVNLNGATVKFKMRKVGSSTLKVDQTATIVNPPGTDGLVRYDWAAVDVDTAGEYLVWWEVTSGGKKQDMMEARVAFDEHAPLASYVELEQFKGTLTLTGTTFTDRDARKCLVASARAVDYLAGQRFYLDPDATSVRYYTAGDDEYELAIDPLAVLTSVKIDRDGIGAYEETWVRDTDFVLEPVNAPLDGRPWTRIRIRPQSTTFAGYFPCTYPNAIEVKGQFGWPAVPAAVEALTSLIAARLFKAVREAPWGVVGFDQEGAVRISRSIPDLDLYLDGIKRRKLLV